MDAKLDKFFENTNILVTGGTGFIGKVLIEKLLRCQTNINKIFLLIRPKKGKDIEDRAKTVIFDQSIFNQLKKINPNYMDKIVIMQGDITEPSLGLSEEDIGKILNEVNIIYNCAASTNLAANLKHHIKFNVKSVLELLGLSRRMISLKALVVVSTAYSNCIRKVIEEKIYEVPVSLELVMKMCEELDDNSIEEITKIISNGHPNAYTFSKSILENSLGAYWDLPLVLFRPAAVTTAYLEPLPGWTDNLSGPMGVYFGSALGFLRVTPFNGQIRSNWVPVDYCTNALICSAWHGTQSSSSNNNNEMLIYNYACEKFKRTLKYYFGNLNKRNIRLEREMWKQILINAGNDYLYYILLIFVQYMPLYVLDIFLFLSGNKIRVSKIYNEKIHPLMKVLKFFGRNEWTFGEENITNMWESLSEEEKKRYFFDSSTIDFDTYITNFWIGIKVYLAKETMETNNKALRKDKILNIAHYFLMILVFVAMIWFLYNLFAFILKY